MAQTYGGGFIVATATGISAVTGAASARSPIPVDGSGNRPNFIRVASRNECYVKIGDVTVVATINDIIIQPADSVIIQVPKGATNIAYIQGVTAGFVNVTPMDNS